VTGSSGAAGSQLCFQGVEKARPPADGWTEAGHRDPFLEPLAGFADGSPANRYSCGFHANRTDRSDRYYYVVGAFRSLAGHATRGVGSTIATTANNDIEYASVAGPR
jgi:hypothetical protein